MRKYEKGHYLFMATKKGLVKKTPLEEYENVRKTGLAAIALRDDDELIEVKTTDNEKEIILVTKFGQCIRFKENDVRTTGRVSMGVRGINLLDGDEVVGHADLHAGRLSPCRIRKRHGQTDADGRVYRTAPRRQGCQML